MSKFIRVIICTLLFVPTVVFTQELTRQPIRGSIISVQVIEDGLDVAISYVSIHSEPLEFTLDSIAEKAGFASDNLGNRYILVNATGMARNHDDPNRNLTAPNRPKEHSKFLTIKPNMEARTLFHFKRTTPLIPGREIPTSFTISVGHYARPIKNFNPQKPAGYIGFTVTEYYGPNKPDKQPAKVKIIKEDEKTSYFSIAVTHPIVSIIGLVVSILVLYLRRFVALRKFIRDLLVFYCGIWVYCFYCVFINMVCNTVIKKPMRINTGRKTR